MEEDITGPARGTWTCPVCQLGSNQSNKFIIGDYRDKLRNVWRARGDFGSLGVKDRKLIYDVLGRRLKAGLDSDWAALFT